MLKLRIEWIAKWLAITKERKVGKKMHYIRQTIFFISHLHRYIDLMVNTLGNYSYLVLFVNFVLETGGLILGFLPGDSLVVAAAAYTAYQPEKLNVFLVYFTILVATILGDALSFHIGRFFGKKYTKKRNFKFFTEEQFDKVHAFFVKNGKKSFLINRFIPFARAWLPFTAGFTQVEYLTIAPYNIVGCITWTTSYVLLGYFFGNTRVVRNNFSLIILIVLIVSSIPATVMLIINRHKIKSTFSKKETEVSKEDVGSENRIENDSKNNLEEIQE